jgi:hypothetical protein
MTLFVELFKHRFRDATVAKFTVMQQHSVLILLLHFSQGAQEAANSFQNKNL